MDTNHPTFSETEYFPGGNVISRTMIPSFEERSQIQQAIEQSQKEMLQHQTKNSQLEEDRQEIIRKRVKANTMPKIQIKFGSRITSSTNKKKSSDEDFEKYWQYRQDGQIVNELTFEPVVDDRYGQDTPKFRCYQLRSIQMIE